MSDNPYDAGQTLARLNRPDEATAGVNLAAIAHELRTANLLEARKQRVDLYTDYGARQITERLRSNDDSDPR